MPELVVASFNAHCGIDGWGRPYDVGGVCRALDADVMVLQEAWFPEEGPSFVDCAAQALGYRVDPLVLAQGHLLGPHPRPGAGWGPRPRRSLAQRALRLDGEGGARARAVGWPADRHRHRGSWGMAVLSRLPVNRLATIDLGQLARDPARRGAVTVEVAAGAGRLLVIGTHLSHITHGSLRQLRRLAAAMGRPGLGAVLLGDMNLWGPPVSLALPGWRRAVRGRTWPSARPHSQLDHALVTADVHVLDAAVLRLGSSDHLPVRVRLAIP